MREVFVGRGPDIYAELSDAIGQRKHAGQRYRSGRNHGAGEHAEGDGGAGAAVLDR